MGTLGVKGLTGDVVNQRRCETLCFWHQAHILVAGGPAAAWRIAVDLRDAVLMQFQREVIGEPGAPRVSSSGMTRPPGDLDGSPEGVPIFPQDPRHLEHRGVTDRVVAHAVIPGVVVSVQQDERFGIFMAWNCDDRDR